MTYRLALDLGATSLGWAALKLDGSEVAGILALGVRVYDDGRDAKSKEPTAVARRLARGARRNRDRKKRRVNRLRDRLAERGLFPSDSTEQKALECRDPWALRRRALDERLEPFELGRAFLHMAQRRGFKSNRKSDRGDNEAGPVKEAAARLEQEILAAGARTLGEYLDGCAVKRVRLTSKTGKKSEYTIYPYRSMYEDEFAKIIQAQKPFHGDLLSDDAVEAVRKIIFFQRDLRRQNVGLCAFEYEAREPRAPRALPVVQEFRIFQEVANLDFERYGPDEPGLSPEQKTQIADLLNKKEKVTFKGIRRALEIGDEHKFNLEHDARKELKGNHTSAKLSRKQAFGARWFDFSLEEQTAIVEHLLNEENEHKLIQWLQDRHGLTQEQAQCVSDTSLAEGYGRLSVKAIEKILPFLKQGMIYSEACQRAGYHHSDRRTGEIFDVLPYYGEVLPHRVIPGTNDDADRDNPELFYGKVNNPTVHIVMNQLRKLVNAAIEKWGHPDSIAIELFRDLKVPAKEANKINARNQKDNERIAKELETLGERNTYANRMRYKLWEDLSPAPNARCCPFTGTTIAACEIFSPEFEEEHLIPFSRSFDNGRNNKVLARREANRAKKNRTPYEAFGTSPVINGQKYSWTKIQARAAEMDRKRWRFGPDAMEKMDDRGGLLARQENDTKYLSRLAKEYLQFVCDPNKIATFPGQLTAMLRRKWGLENLWEDGPDGEKKKDRSDHRHHALDAFVIGCMTRSMLQKVASAARGLENDAALQDKRHRLVENMPVPYEGYWKDAKHHFDSMVISHKPDRGNARKARAARRPYTTAALHEETAYGLVQENSSKGKNLYVVRKPVDGMEKIKDLEQIVDPVIRHRFMDAVAGLKDGSKDFKEALLMEAESRDPIIRRVRCHVEKSADVMIPVRDRKTGQAYKHYQGGGNACAEIYMPMSGKSAGKWQVEIISRYAAHNPCDPDGTGRTWKRDHPAAKLVMRLHRNDMVAYEDENGNTVIAKVKKMTGKQVYLRPHTIAQEESDKLSWGAYSSGMQQKNLRKISVDILGQVRDGGRKNGRRGAAPEPGDTQG